MTCSARVLSPGEIQTGGKRDLGKEVPVILLFGQAGATAALHSRAIAVSFERASPIRVTSPGGMSAP